MMAGAAGAGDSGSTSPEVAELAMNVQYMFLPMLLLVLWVLVAAAVLLARRGAGPVAADVSSPHPETTSA